MKRQEPTSYEQPASEEILGAVFFTGPFFSVLLSVSSVQKMYALQ
jgi:hypothetical protein